MGRVQTLRPRLQALDTRVGVRSAGILIKSGDRAEQRKRYDLERSTRPSRKWYNSAKWRALRAAQLAAEPLCAYCLGKGLMTKATVCDHIHPHRDDEAKFWAGPFGSLCRTCHDGVKQSEEAGQW